ncbi:MAG: hypothetical protein U0K80_02275 [Methanobrevibacter sp.]|nr:hypothetical protein [Methanobrevibacter sp.]
MNWMVITPRHNDLINNCSFFYNTATEEVELSTLQVIIIVL